MTTPYRGEAPALSTAIRIDVELKAFAQCSSCGSRLQIGMRLVEDSLTTGNTTQRASYAAAALRTKLEVVKKNCLWDEETCGRCRIARGEKASVNIVELAHPQGVEP